jgi:hypothetical protein
MMKSRLHQDCLPTIQSHILKIRINFSTPTNDFQEKNVSNNVILFTHMFRVIIIIIITITTTIFIIITTTIL